MAKVLALAALLAAIVVYEASSGLQSSSDALANVSSHDDALIISRFMPYPLSPRWSLRRAT